MKDAAPFESTPEFQHFTDVMRKVIRVPKAEMLAKAAATPKKKRDYSVDKNKKL